MLAYSIGTIAATAVLYVLTWLPLIALGGTPLEQVNQVGNGPMGPLDRLDPRAPRDVPPEAMPAFGEQPPWIKRIFSQLLSVGPGLLLAAAISLGAVALLGAASVAMLTTEPRSEPIRRGTTALGLSLTPLVCSSLVAILLLLLGAPDLAVPCAGYGCFIAILMYHQALQVIGGIPLNRMVYCSPILIGIGLFLLIRFSVFSGGGLMAGAMGNLIPR